MLLLYDVHSSVTCIHIAVVYHHVCVWSVFTSQLPEDAGIMELYLFMLVNTIVDKNTSRFKKYCVDLVSFFKVGE